MTLSTYRFSILLFLLIASVELAAQTSELTLTGGILQSGYRFAPRTLFPYTSPSFPWEGSYTRANPFVGVGYCRSIRPRWRIETGLRLALSGYTQEKDFHWPSEFNPDGTYSAVLPADRLTVNHLFLEIPLTARYQFSGAQLSPYAEMTVFTNYYLTTGVKERLEGQTKKFRTRSDTVQPIQFSVQLAAGLQIQLSRRQTAFIQTGLIYLLNRVEKDVENPGIGYGVNAGWRLRLKA